MQAHYLTARLSLNRTILELKYLCPVLSGCEYLCLNRTILELKYHFNRPRPYQLAKHYNLDLGGITLESMKSPSFPSGHSTQGYLIGKILQTKLSIDTNAFLEVAKNTSFSRNVGRAHYLSDSQVGEKLGNDMYQYLIKKI